MPPALPQDVHALVDAFASGWSPTPSAQAYKAVRDSPVGSRLSIDRTRALRTTTRNFVCMSVRVVEWILEMQTWRRVFEDVPPTEDFAANLQELCFDRCCEIKEWRELVEVEPGLDGPEECAWLRDFERRHWQAFSALCRYGAGAKT